MKTINQFIRDSLIAYRRTYSSDRENYGIVTGDVGLLLVFSKLYQYTKEEYYADQLFLILDDLLADAKSDFTLGSGVTGLAWCFSRIDPEIIENGNEWLASIHIPLLEEYTSLIEKKNFDYFSGATGLLLYFLTCRISVPDPEDCINLYLKAVQTELTHERFYRMVPGRQNGTWTHILNLGTPHGVTGVLLLLLMIKEKGYSVEKEMIDRIIIYICSYKMCDAGKNGYYFPGKVEEETIYHPSGIAWCYGDVMIGYALIKAGILYNDLSYQKEGEHVLCHTLDGGIYHSQNLILCHGYSSLYIIYDKLFELTNDKKYQLHSLDCFKKLQSSFRLSYKGYRMTGKGDFFDSPALLYGFSGFILTWLYRAEGEKEWTNCLLL